VEVDLPPVTIKQQDDLRIPRIALIERKERIVRSFERRNPLTTTDRTEDTNLVCLKNKVMGERQTR
jgi:hypothetical protein